MNFIVRLTTTVSASALTLLLAAMLPVTAQAADAPFVPLAPAGQSFIHDPSTIISEGNTYYIFGTGPGLRTKISSDLAHWTNGDSVFHTFPAWIKTYVPAFRFNAWAPDIIHVNGKYLLYYAASTWGKRVSAIGLATSPTLDQSATNYVWSDAGLVITSTEQSAYNTIDPSVMRDRDGKLWLAFGSYWQGIFLTELDPQTGLRVSTNSPLYHLAWNDSIEASCITRHDNYYYLFVNWGQCCKGTNSTYEVRVGRATNVTGPYLDRDGKRLVDGGGSVFLKSNGRFIGPGHIGILDDGKDSGWFSFHYYDADTEGRSRLGLGKMDWSDGWPKAVTGDIKN